MYNSVIIFMITASDAYSSNDIRLFPFLLPIILLPTDLPTMGAVLLS